LRGCGSPVETFAKQKHRPSWKARLGGFSFKYSNLYSISELTPCVPRLGTVPDGRRDPHAHKSYYNEKPNHVLGAAARRPLIRCLSGSV
ncbi:MAG: hypothetical protein IIY78_02165, partial [Clostridia bacterium]|nr:hypothetical protein [Clostridia bacterium]